MSKPFRAGYVMVAPTIGVKHVTKTIMLLTNKISIKSFRMLRTEVITWTTSEEGNSFQIVANARTSLVHSLTLSG